jgi:outer membrane protein
MKSRLNAKAAVACAIAGAVVGAIGLASLAPTAVCMGEAPTDSLTIEDAVRLALAVSPAVTQAEQAVLAAEARIGSSTSARYPDIAFEGSYTRIGPVPEITFAGSAFKLAPANNYDLHLGLNQTVYDFGRTSTAVDLARAGRQSATDYVEQVKSAIAYQTMAVFNSILILRESVAVLDDQISALKRHIDVSRKKVEAGTATDFDVLTTRVRVAAATNDRIEAATNLETQEIMFRKLVGLAESAPVAVSGAFAKTQRTFADSVLLSMALADRPEMVAARDAEMTASLQVRLASLGDRPSVGLILSSGLATGYPDNLNQLKANYAAGVNLRVPIFNGHLTRSRRSEAEAGLHMAQARSEDTKRQIRAEVEQAAASVRAYWEKTRNAEVLVKQAEEAVAMAKVRYEAGVVTNLDVLDAQTALTQAKLAYLRSLYAYSMSLVDLDRATGKKAW